MDEFKIAKVTHTHEPAVTPLGMFAVLDPLHRCTPYDTLFKSLTTEVSPRKASPWDMENYALLQAVHVGVLLVTLTELRT